MIKQSSKAGKAVRESAWRDRLMRYASSGQSVEAFCQSESVSTASFYGWRSKLRAREVAATTDKKMLPVSSPFIDLGSISAPVSASTPAPGEAAHSERRCGFEVRIDLGDGVRLTLMRH